MRGGAELGEMECKVGGLELSVGEEEAGERGDLVI